MIDIAILHRPTTFDEIVGQEHIIPSVKNIILRHKSGGSKGVPSFLFLGMAGVGKTSTAEVITRELFGEDWLSHFHRFNSSKERGIKTVREDIVSISRLKGKRVILLDEADNLTQDAQQALRGVMEEKNDCIFILTGNFDHKIIEAIRNRCAEYRFVPLSDVEVMKQVIVITNKENIEIDKNAFEGLKTLVRSAKGSVRKALINMEKVINQYNTITKELVDLTLQVPELIEPILVKTIDGNFFEAFEELQKHYVLRSFSATTIVDEILMVTSKLPLTDIQKVSVLRWIDDLEYRLVIGCNPLTQLTGFLSKIWLLRHVEEK